MITKAQLAKISSELDHDIITRQFTKYDITTQNRQAMFLAQCAHESANFKAKVENLNYSAEALDKVFPKYFKDAGRNAQDYHRKPE